MDVRLEVRHLKLLVAIAEKGSVTEAGKRLHLTQSALSHQLRDAEDKLGTALFLRLGKRMVLTPAGEKLLDCARLVLEELGYAETQIQGLNGGTRGVIRLSTECYTCYHWLPPVLKKFHHRFAKVEVSIDASATDNPAVALLDGKLDVAIMNTPPRNKALRLTPMFEDELVLVMAPEHRLASCDHVQPRELAGETVVIYPPREESTLLRRVLQPAGVEPQRIIEAPLTEAIIEMAAAGTGIGFLARWAVAPHVEAGRVVVRPVCSRGFRRQWYAVTLKKQPAPPYLDAFLDLLATHAPKQARA
jgi:LysR family transcriptional regulator, regulator for metE and metH